MRLVAPCQAVRQTYTRMRPTEVFRLIPILNQNLLCRLPLAVLFILSAARLLVIFDLEIE